MVLPVYYVTVVNPPSQAVQVWLLLQATQFSIPQGWQRFSLFRKNIISQVEHFVAFVQLRHPSGHLEQLPFVETNMPVKQNEQIGTEDLAGKTHVRQKDNAI